MAGGLPPHLYLSELKNRNIYGITDTLVEKMYRRIREVDRVCETSGVTPIYTLAHLAEYCGINYYLLDNLVTSVENNYETIYVKRKLPGKPSRTISKPSELLKMVQSEILHRALPSEGSVHSYAYTRGRNARMAVEQHVGAQTLISLDISDFFDRCRSSDVHALYRTLGYPDLLSLQLTSLATRGMNLTKLLPRRPGIDQPYIFQGGYLPQGAPTSGMLSNLILSEFDGAVFNIIEGRGGVYSRYSDDLNLSFPMRLSKSDLSALIYEIRECLGFFGFQLNDEKSRIQHNHSSLSLLGFSIQGEKVFLNKRYRNRVFCLMRAVDKHGIESFVERHSGVTEESLLATIEGHFVFSYGNDREFANRIQGQYKSIMKRYRSFV